MEVINFLKEVSEKNYKKFYSKQTNKGIFYFLIDTTYFNKA